MQKTRLKAQLGRVFLILTMMCCAAAIISCENQTWIEKNYRTGQIGQRNHYVGDTLNGTSYWFANQSNAPMIESTQYKNGFMHGVNRKFADDGTLIEMAIYENHELNGERTQWNEKGELISHEHYAKGLKHGVCSYYQSRMIEQRLSFNNGALQGYWVKFENGVPMDSILYENNLEIR